MVIDELDNVMGNSRLKTKKWKKILHNAVQPHMAISWLAKVLSKPQTAHIYGLSLSLQAKTDLAD